MKYLLPAIVLLIAATLCHAEEQSLLNGRITHGGYGAPVLKMTNVNGEFTALMGGQGAWIINHTFALGGAGYGMASEQDYNGPTYLGEPEHVGFGYGGVILSYIHESDRILHPTFDLLIGGGAITLYQRDYYSGDDNWENSNEIGHDGFMVIEPSVNGELNIVRFMRAQVGVSYRWVNGVSHFGYDNADYSGVAVSLTLKFGKF